MGDYLLIDDHWGVIDTSKCFNMVKCTLSAVTFPLCNPQNLNNCEHEELNATENFLQYVELDGNIQIITTITVCYLF